jgi:hypothetical protein
MYILLNPFFSQSVSQSVRDRDGVDWFKVIDVMKLRDLCTANIEGVES